MKNYIYSGKPDELSKIKDLLKEEVKILCPICQEELIVALDLESAGKYGVHPGIYCPNNKKHMNQLFSIKKFDWSKIDNND